MILLLPWVPNAPLEQTWSFYCSPDGVLVLIMEQTDCGHFDHETCILAQDVDGVNGSHDQFCLEFGQRENFLMILKWVGPFLRWWPSSTMDGGGVNSSLPGQNGRQFGRQHFFLMHFSRMKMKEFWFKFHWNLFPRVQSGQIGDKPLSEPMLTWITDAYMRHEGEINLPSEAWIIMLAILKTFLL